MNKISKKIVALATMAAFVLTLVPAAAFGAEPAELSSVEFAGNKDTVSLGTDGEAELEITLNVGEKDAAKAPIYIWLTKDDSNAIYRGVTYTGADNNTSTGELVNAAVITKATADTAGEDITIKATVKADGTYTVHGGIANSTGAKESRDELSIFDSVDTIVVKAAEAYVNKIEITSPEVTETQGQDGGTINYAGGAPNGVRSTKVVAQLTSVYEDGTEGASSEGKILNVENPYTSNFTISNADGVVSDENPIVADEDGVATFYVKATEATRNGTYTLTLSADDATYLLSIFIGNDDYQAATIEAVDTGRTAIEKAKLTNYSSLETVAQFTVKNAAGDVLTPADKAHLEGFSAFTDESSSTSLNNTVGIVSGPEEGKDAVFKVVGSSKNADNFALQIVDPSKLALGQYTVRVALDNNKSADVTFTVAKFGKVVDTIIEFTDGKDNVVTEVVDGQEYKATAVQVDENGLTKPLTAANMGYKGSAVVAQSVDISEAGSVKFKVSDDETPAINDNSYIGSKIGVWAFTTAYGQYAYGEVTVVDKDNVDNYTLEFDPTVGPAGEDNEVAVTVINEDGEKVNVTGDLYVHLLDKSVEDANVYVAPKGSVEKGKGELVINSDKETELEIVVGVRDDNNVIVANTLNFTVGAQDPNADTTIVMTIGSTDYVVNNKILTGDAAPYVDSNWRTMVPFRVLGETFGATVNWDQDAQTVTYTLGDTELTMTIGEETYTVNGDEKTMDTAPVLSGDRTFVPVRFVAEALGYTVVPLQDANGLTASVVFQK